MIDSPRCAEGGPRRGAGTAKRASTTAPGSRVAGIAGSGKASCDEELAARLHPVLGGGDVAVGVAILPRARHLVEPQPDQPQRRLAGVDPLRGRQAERPGDPLADHGRAVQDDLAGDRAVGRAEQLVGRDGVERVAPLRSGQARPVDGVERLGRRAGVAAERAEVQVQVQGHLGNSVIHAAGATTLGVIVSDAGLSHRAPAHAAPVRACGCHWLRGTSVRRVGPPCHRSHRAGRPVWAR